MLPLLGKDKQDLGGNLTVASRVLEQYPANTDLDDDHAVLFPSGLSRKIRCGGAGNLLMLMRDGSTSKIQSVLAGETIEVECVKVLKTGTTATLLTVFF